MDVDPDAVVVVVVAAAAAVVACKTRCGCLKDKRKNSDRARADHASLDQLGKSVCRWAADRTVPYSLKNGCTVGLK